MKSIIETVIIIIGIPFLLLSCTPEPDVEESGGVYAMSPDGHWLASISDGYNKANDKKYATVYLWDLNKYPSLNQDFYTTYGKHPEIKLTFPQEFRARDGHSKISWNESSSEFTLEYKIIEKNEKKWTNRIFVYDIKSNQFRIFEKSNLQNEKS